MVEELTYCQGCNSYISLRAYDFHVMRCGEQPMVCRWCDVLHYGGPENCNNPQARPATAFSAGDRDNG